MKDYSEENEMVCPAAEVSMPEVEFIREVPLQVGGLPARINLALADFHADKPDIDIMALLLEECLNTIETADKNFQNIVKRCESMSAAIDNLRAVVGVQAE